MSTYMYVVTRWNKDHHGVVTIAPTLELANRAAEVDRRMTKEGDFSYIVESKNIFTEQVANDIEGYLNSLVKL